MLGNPFASVYFPGILQVVGGLLGGALLVIAAIARFRWPDLTRGVLFRRWLVWAIVAPTFILAVLAGAPTFGVLLALLAIQGLREYGRLVGLPPAYRAGLMVAGALVAPAALLAREAFVALPVAVLLAGMLRLVVWRDGTGDVRHLAFAALGWGYVAWLPGHLMLIHTGTAAGPAVLLVIALATALSDVGAFAFGRLCGRTPLAPTISPGKTREGVIGNVAGAYLGVGLLTLAFPVPIFGAVGVLLPLVIAVGAVWGDLVESAIKREFGAKDAGAWLPGFGGLLDRVDSLLVVAPLTFYVLLLTA